LAETEAGEGWRLDLDKDFAALDQMSKARFNFEQRLCEASATQDEKVLDELRQEKMFEFAQFFFTIMAMGLDGPDDAAILAELHNERIDKLLRDKGAMRRRGFREDRLLKAIFTADTRPRLEHIWRERPGALDQSNLARFPVTQMSSETVRKLVEACEAAGFVERKLHPFGAIVVASRGVIERVLASSLRDMRITIAQI
jgi:hypothetical protein